MTRNMRIYGFTLLAGLLGSGCTGVGGDTSVGDGSEGSADDDDDDDDDKGDDDDDGGSTGGEGGDTPGGTTDTVGNDTGEDDTTTDPTVCVPGVPTTSQIPRMRNAQYDAVIRDLLGLAQVDGMAPSAVGPLADDFDGEMNKIAWNGYLVSADKIAAATMAGTARSNFIECDPAAEGCLEDTIRNFGRKAFRRPLTEEEVGSFLRLTTDVEPPGTPEEHAEAILLAFLASPSFILIPELVEEEMEGNAVKLSSHEVAARLSFLLWGSIPDDVLNAAADAGALQTREQILEQAARMVQVREKSGPIMSALHRHYAVAPSPHWTQSANREHPLYTPEVNRVMLQELDAFFEEVALSGGTFSDIFLSDVAYVNNVTAPIYGLDAGGFGPELTRVTLDPTERPGFLTRIAFLSAFAHEESTSPALRGAFVSQHIIGTAVNPPPPGATDVPPPPGVFETERAMIEALTGADDCKGCHLPIINPPGYVLEHYDFVGAWQDVDPRGGTINATADVAFSGGVKTINSPFELMQELATNEGTMKKYAEKVVEYATRRNANSNDTCVVEELGMKLANGYTLLDVVVDLTQTDSFRLRRASN